MWLVPDWAPNLHPLVVHFPIAVILAALVVDAVGLRRPERDDLRHTATWLYVLGALWAQVAYATGRAGLDVLGEDLTAPAVARHEQWAFVATWFFGFFISLRLAMSYIWRPRPLVAMAAFVAALGGGLLIVETTRLGAGLVYDLGIGVGTAQRP